MLGSCLDLLCYIPYQTVVYSAFWSLIRKTCKNKNCFSLWAFNWEPKTTSSICSSLLTRNTNLSFFQRIISGDENELFQMMKKTVVVTKGETAANIETGTSFTEIIALCMGEYKMRHTRRSIWNGLPIAADVYCHQVDHEERALFLKCYALLHLRAIHKNQL